MFRKCLVMLAAVSAIASWGQATQAAEKIGKVVAVVGSPSANGRKLSGGSDVFEDDRIVVKSGNAQILLDDNTRIVVGPNSTLVLDQFVRKDKGTASKVAIKALRGTYRFITGRSAKSAYKITTAQATIGIRGTGFDFWTIKKTGAAVMSGRVNLRGLNGGSTELGSACEVGEATTNTAKAFKGRAKADLIKQNLPFILDQSSLRPRFRLNINLCNVSAPNNERSSRPPETPRNNDRDTGNDGGGTTNPDTGGGGTTNPDTGGGDTTIPDTGGGGTTNPDTGGGVPTNPDTGGGGTTNPDTGGGGTTNPDTGGGVPTNPDTGGGVPTNPDTGGGVPTNPDTGGATGGSCTSANC